ncbi:hypothetical protein DUE52_23875 [Larkinella punicea]|uniref:Uncharacterized protein n=1 Tax=Larkinella punicea TaxID=2315727 RepID=A0A368JIH2_9BACT|nr:hypothetical protein DUE52_23875 [Larkinella punicea]
MTAPPDRKYLKKWPRAGGPVELSYAKNSFQEAARELGIDLDLLIILGTVEAGHYVGIEVEQVRVDY